MSFDIETEGLNFLEHAIATACVYDPDRGIERTFQFLDTDDDKEISERVEEFLNLLDEAPALCCFNGVKFDIPFIAHRFQVQESRVHQWMLKVFDVFEVCRLGFGSSCSLDALLKVCNMYRLDAECAAANNTWKNMQANGYNTVKSASGLQALEWIKVNSIQSVDSFLQTSDKKYYAANRRKNGSCWETTA